MKKFWENFKKLPRQTKSLLGVGVVLALLVALPLFVWAVLFGRFELRKKAQVEPSPTPSTAPSPTASPQPGCVHGTHSVSLIPENQSGYAGETKIYNVKVTNNDDSTCGLYVFNLSRITLSADWGVNFSISDLALNPQESGTATVSFTSPLDSPIGELSVGVLVRGPSANVAASSTFNVLSPTPAPTATAKPVTPKPATSRPSPETITLEAEPSPSTPPASAAPEVVETEAKPLGFDLKLAVFVLIPLAALVIYLFIISRRGGKISS